MKDPELERLAATVRDAVARSPQVTAEEALAQARRSLAGHTAPSRFARARREAKRRAALGILLTIAIASLAILAIGLLWSPHVALGLAMTIAYAVVTR